MGTAHQILEELRTRGVEIVVLESFGFIPNFIHSVQAVMCNLPISSVLMAVSIP